MVLVTVVLFLANTLLTTGLAVLEARGTASVPHLAFFVSTVGRILGELLAFIFSVSLFYVTYRYASVRRLPWRTALLASTFTAVLFEVAKRLYGLYLANFASLESQGGDANVGAVVLFILWLYYTAIVFLLGAVVAETWELRSMQERQRATLG
jgi:membrane protein